MIFSKKAIVLAGVALLAIVPLRAQVKQTREEYIDKYKQIAVAHMERYGIPASITMAQGILESNCGNSWLSQASNNHFGIKCKRNWTGEKVYYDDDEKGECFRAYPSVEASYADHAEFLDSQPRYASLFSYDPTDYKSWARGLEAARYATAPDYAERLIRIIEECKLFLLDQENGVALYAQNTRHDANDWFAEQSSVDEAIAISGEGVDPDDFRVTVNAHRGYNVYRINNVNYILAKDGDTFEKISKDFRVSARNLRKFNDVDKNAQPVAGETIYIGRKKKRWTGNTLLHTVKEGETIWSLSQSYGIRSKSLARMNKLDPNARLTTGMEIKLR